MTAVHDVVNELVTRFHDALSPNWQVLDGWNGHTDLADRVLVVAFAATPGAQAIDSQIAVDEGGLCALVETVTVSCTAGAWDGNMEFTAKRADVASMLTTLRAKLAEDPKLGGFALDAYVAPQAQWYTAIQQRTKDSSARANVEVDFSVTVEVHAE